MSIGLPLHLMSTSVSLCTVTSVLVKIEMVPLSEVFPTLINDVRMLMNVSACVALFDTAGNGRWVTGFALNVMLLATPNRLLHAWKMGIRASFLSSLLTQCLLDPELYLMCTVFAHSRSLWWCV